MVINLYAVLGVDENNMPIVTFIHARSMSHALDIFRERRDSSSIKTIVFIRQEPRGTAVGYVGNHLIPQDVLDNVSVYKLLPFINAVFPLSDSCTANLSELKKDIKIVVEGKFGVQDAIDIIRDTAMMAIHSHKSDQLSDNPDDILHWRLLNIINDLFHL